MRSQASGLTGATVDRVGTSHGRLEVLKGLAEFNGETLGELLEKIVLHSFEPVPGDEGESCASPHSKAT